MVPVVNHELVHATVAYTEVYQVQSFDLSEWSGLSGKNIATACTPTVILTGTPESITDPSQAERQRALFSKIKTAPENAFLPKEGRLARLISGKTIPGSMLKEMLSAYDVARRTAEATQP